jgi:membrane protein YdbS with pleckstrin-like domain
MNSDVKVSPKKERNREISKWVLAATGYLPVGSAWVWYLVSLEENWIGSAELMSWLLGSTVVLMLVSWGFRRCYFEWIAMKAV